MAIPKSAGAVKCESEGKDQRKKMSGKIGGLNTVM